MTFNCCNLLVHYICRIFEIQTIKPFIVPEINFKDHSMSSVMSSFIRLPGLFIRDWKSVLDLLVFLDTIAEMTLKVDQGHW